MAAKKYLDNEGLATLWAKIKNLIAAQTIKKTLAVRPRANNPILIINPLNENGDSQLNSHPNVYIDSTHEYNDVLTIGDGITGMLNLKIGGISHVLHPNVTTGNIDVYLPKESGELALVSTLNTMDTNIKSLLSSTYATKTDLSSGLSGKANSSHTHTIANITNLQSVLDGKAASSHNHSASNITSGTLAVARGGTGQTSTVNAANAFINALTEGTSIPVDNDYMITQHASGGTTTTTYHRRKMSVVWEYFKSKIGSVCGSIFIPTSGSKSITFEEPGYKDGFRLYAYTNGSNNDNYLDIQGQVGDGTNTSASTGYNPIVRFFPKSKQSKFYGKIATDYSMYVGSAAQLYQGSYIHGGLEGTAGSGGYIQFCTITVTKTYANEPFYMTISSRNRLGKLKIHLGLGNTTTISNPIFVWEPDYFSNAIAYVTLPIWYKYSGSTLYLYWSKSEAYDSMTVIDFVIGSYMRSHLSVEWNNTLVSSNSGLTKVTNRGKTFDEHGNNIPTYYATKTELNDKYSIYGGEIQGDVTVIGNIITPGDDRFGMYPTTNCTGKIGRETNMYFKGYFEELRLKDEIEFLSAVGSNEEDDGNSYNYKIITNAGKCIQVLDSCGTRDIMGSRCESYVVPGVSGGTSTAQKILTLGKKTGCRVRMIITNQYQGTNNYYEFTIWVAERLGYMNSKNIVISKLNDSAPSKLLYTFDTSTRTFELYDVTEFYNYEYTLIVEPFTIPGNTVTVYPQSSTRITSSTLSLTSL